jgi:polyphosphate kinase
MIRRETRNASAGKPAHIIAKMNSLCDKEVIAALYEASCAGVNIQLIVRGICSLKAGVPGLSENITVRSIVGNFLEHARIFYFENDGSPELYLGSADWMPRNLDKRVEVMFPVEDEKLMERICHVLKIQLEDNVKSHILKPDGTWEKPDKRGKTLINSQEQFCEEVIHSVRAELGRLDPSGSRVFIPTESQG